MGVHDREGLLSFETHGSPKGPRTRWYPAFFYHSYWHIIGSHVTNAVLSCLNSCKILKSINHTFITLIPKVQALKECLNFALLVYVMLYIKSSQK